MVLRGMKRPPKADSCGHQVSVWGHLERTGVNGDSPRRQATERSLHLAVAGSYRSAPCSQATSPTQPFAMGPSPKQATVSE